jgi:hypothetical protein
MITFAFWWVLAIRLPVASYIPYWFWQVTTSPRTAWWLFPPILILSISVIFVVRRVSRSVASVLVIIVTGVIIQHVFGLMEGRGIDGIRDKTITTGHANFAIDAVRESSFLFVASFYDNLIVRKILPDYPYSTKPPGQLLFYMLNERAAHFLPGVWDSELQRLATFMTITWPVLAYIPVIFIYILSREIHEKNESNIIASLIYIFIPSITLIPLHLDQCLYPLLFVFSLVVFIFGIKKNSLLLFFVSGFVTGMAMFVSFSLIALPLYILLILMIKTVVALLPKEQPFSYNFVQILRENFRIGLMYVLGLFFLEALLFFYLGYNVVENYQFAMSNHFSSKLHDWSLQITLVAGALNVLEYSLWTGVPLFGLMIIFGVRSFKKLMAGKSDVSLIMGAATLILFFTLALFSRTAGETARLWIFLTPLTVIFSAKEIANMFRERTWNTVTFLILLQMITAFSLKMWQDFR